MGALGERPATLSVVSDLLPGRKYGATVLKSPSQRIPAANLPLPAAFGIDERPS